MSKLLGLWIFAGVFFVSSAVLAAQAGVGIVKGTITIDGKPATDAVVSIEGIPNEQAKARMALVKPRKKIMNQKDLQFIPTTVAVMVGETVEFPNNDKVWHNVYSKGGADDFDLGLYPPGKTRSQKFDRPGVARILCNAHPKMEGFIIVKDHPFFSTTNGRGNYEIKNVPLGKLRVEIWYPNLEIRSEPVPLVRDGEVFVLNVDLKRR